MKAAAPPNRLRELRNARDLTQDEVAERFGIDPATLSRWECRKSRILDERKSELAEFFGVSVAFLMLWDEPTDNGNGHELAEAA